MGDLEKPISLYEELVISLLKDTANLLGIKEHRLEKDIESIHRRFAAEGLSFLTKTLPSLGKHLDRALGRDEPLGGTSDFPCGKQNYPRFLGAIWGFIFDSEGMILEPGRKTNELLSQILAVRAIRQICYLVYKLDGSATKQDSARVLDEFISVDASLPEPSAVLALSKETSHALENARILLLWLLGSCDPSEIIPKHGPGAVATREKPWQKMNFARYYGKLDEMYPYSEYFFFNYTHLCDDLGVLEGMAEMSSPQARVALVPKDSRGPRLISMEPLELQWIQQGLFSLLTKRCEEWGSPCYGYVNFTDQRINRWYALSSSEFGEFATLDLKDASDRVSLWLVRTLFPAHLVKYLEACRSEETRLPDGRVVRLKKFAPMGSAVTFPIEAITFWSLAVGALQDILTGKDIYSLPPVYVYGDDIICAKSAVDKIRPVFEELFLRLNESKCCVGRFFRESCGCDAFRLNDVTPVRLKREFGRRLSPKALLSYVAYVNAFTERGFHLTANLLRSWVERTESGSSIPWRAPGANVMLAWVLPGATRPQILYMNDSLKQRWNRKLQRREYRIRVVCPIAITHGEPDWSELFRLFPRGTPNPSIWEIDEPRGPNLHLLPNQIKLGWKWVPVESFHG